MALKQSFKGTTCARTARSGWEAVRLRQIEAVTCRFWDREHPWLTLITLANGTATLEDQLPALIRLLEIDKAEAEWSQKEEEPRADIRKERWEEVKKGGFVRVGYERNVERLPAELGSRDAAATMRLRRRDRRACRDPGGPGRAGGTRVGRADPRACRARTS